MDQTYVTPPPPGGPTPEGLIRVDCHLHTRYSGDAVTTIDELAERIEETGLDVVCVTDHHAVDGAYAALERGVGARVIIGEEIRTTLGEVIGLFLKERIPYVLPLDEVIGRIRAQGGIVYVPHPFDAIRFHLRTHAMEELAATGGLDIVEAFNAKAANQADNQRAAEWARAHDLPVGAGSDAHDPEGLGAAYVEMPEFDGPEDFVRKLHDDRVRVVGEFRDHALRYGPRKGRKTIVG